MWTMGSKWKTGTFNWLLLLFAKRFAKELVERTISVSLTHLRMSFAITDSSKRSNGKNVIKVDAKKLLKASSISKSLFSCFIGRGVCQEFVCRLVIGSERSPRDPCRVVFLFKSVTFTSSSSFSLFQKRHKKVACNKKRRR